MFTSLKQKIKEGGMSLGESVELSRCACKLDWYLSDI